MCAHEGIQCPGITCSCGCMNCMFPDDDDDDDGLVWNPVTHRYDYREVT